MFQIRLQNLFLIVAAIALCLGIGRLASPVLGVYCALLFGIGAFARRQTRRVQGAMLAVSALVAASPFFGPPFSFVVPGSERLVPVCKLALPIYFFRPFYRFGEFPLRVLGNITIHGDFHDVIFFAGSFDVRPFSVFAFWTGIVLVVASSLVSTSVRSTPHGRPKSESQLDTTS
jgi:hypothetical protein